MKPVKCEFGHHYDSEKYSECPHCAKEKEKTIKPVEQEPVTLNSMKILDDVKHNTIKPEAMYDLVHTVVIAQEESEQENMDNVTQQIWNTDEIISSVVNIKEEDETPVMPSKKLGRRPHVTPDDNGKTRVLSESESDPVTGFLIAVSGPHFGEAFLLHSGRNSISRSINSKIQLNKDTMISKSNQMYIVFDNLNNKFLVTPGEANTLSYVNKQPVLQPMAIEAKAEIRVGESILIFIPFLSEEFTWEEYIKGDQK